MIRVNKLEILSIRQPWAELIVSGKKKIEIRSWKTSYRGSLLIHASKSIDREALKYFGMSEKELIRGAIIGVAYLKDVKIYRSLKEFLKDKSLHLSFRYTHKFPIYGFVLDNAKRIEPISCKGKLGIFEVPVDKISCG